MAQPTDRVKETDDHYNSKYWEPMAELEHQMYDGISLKDRIEKEVDLVLQEGRLDLQQGDKVLDLASGTGLHAIRIAELTGAEVEGREIGDKLVEIANKRVTEQQDTIRAETKQQILRVNFAQGNYGEIKSSVAEDQKFKCITCLGASFIYLKSHQAYMNALKDFNDLLEPGGKLVLQWREERSMKNRIIGSPSWCDEREYGFKALPKGKRDSLGRKAGEELYYKKNTPGKKDGYGMYLTKAEENSPNIAQVQPYPDIQGPAGTMDPFKFGRVYVDADGNEIPLETTSGLNFLEKEKFPLIKRMLEEAGFVNIRLIPEGQDGTDLSQDGMRRLFAVVAEKKV